MKNFTYSEKYKLSWSQYNDIWNKKLSEKDSNSTLRRYFKKILGILIVLALFMSKYTIVLGCVSIILILISIFSDKLKFKGLKSNFKGHKYLKHELTYTIDTWGMYVSNKEIYTKCSWKFLVTWQIRGDWLILSPSGIPNLYFSRQTMKDNKIYDQALSIIKENGIEYK